MSQSMQEILTVLGTIMVVCVVVALVGLALMMRYIRNLRIPHDADFFTTLRLVPLPLAVLLDMLDFGLDIFAAPIAWVILDRMGLHGLRNKAAIEAFIPFTGPIPTFTAAWVAARALNLGDPAALPRTAGRDRRIDIIEYDR